MGSRNRIVFSLAVAIAALAAGPALAAAPSAAGRLDGIVDIYMNAAASWEDVLLRAAMGIFGILAAIELTWTLIGLALSRADMGDYISELAKKLIMIGFFLFLLTSAGPIAHAIIDTFRQLGNDAAVAGNGSGGLRPTALFDAGMKAAWGLFNTKTGFAPAEIAKALTLMIAGIVVVICFAVLTAFLIAGLVESYLVTAAGMLMFGLGGSRWTKDFAVKQLTYCVSVGAKLLIIQLLAGTAEAMMIGWTGSVQGATFENLGEVMTIVGASIIMMALVMTLPNIVQGVISGASAGNGGVMGAATMFAGGAVATGAALAGGAMGAGAAMKLAGEQVAAKQASGAMGGGFMQSAAGIVGHTIGNLGAAAASDVGGRLSGRARFGTAGGRMADQMNSKASEMKAGRLKAAAASAEEQADSGSDTKAGGKTADVGNNNAPDGENTIRGGEGGTGVSSEAEGGEPGEGATSTEPASSGEANAGPQPEMAMAGAAASVSPSANGAGAGKTRESAVSPSDAAKIQGAGESGTLPASATSPAQTSQGSPASLSSGVSPTQGPAGQPTGSPAAQTGAAKDGGSKPKAVMSVSAAEAAEMGAFEESALGLDDVTKAALSQSEPAVMAAPSPAPAKPTGSKKLSEAPPRSGLKPGSARRNDALRASGKPDRPVPSQSHEPPSTDDTPPLEDDDD